MFIVQKMTIFADVTYADIVHSDLDHRIVSKKDFQTRFSGQKHLFSWHL